ncbi:MULTISPECIES: hypothetical protein [unclassified Streptomyces]|uniref:hypothetical protein n=1 Tax=unclassified Streptomyces TaxID=2593676 RepID=UPI0037F57661
MHWGWGVAGMVVEVTERYCRTCEQRVPPVVRHRVGTFFGTLAVSQVGAVVVAVLALFHPMSFPPPVHLTAGLIFYLAWPSAVRPPWLGLVAAAAVLAVAALVSAGAGSRARRAATCPTCRLGLDPR